jgi:hypothetical protein
MIWLWVLLNCISLYEETEDKISWNLAASGEYSTTSAYNTQLFGATTTIMNKTVWMTWAPPKIKFFARLANQNRV